MMIKFSCPLHYYECLVYSSSTDPHTLHIHVVSSRDYRTLTSLHAACLHRHVILNNVNLAYNLILPLDFQVPFPDRSGMKLYSL